jgi:hypothetical protein
VAVKFMVVGDRLPVLALTIEADPAELTGITTATPVTLRMRRYGADTPTIADQAAEVTSVDAGRVEVHYLWDTDDTLTAGDYRVEATFTVEGRALTIPADAPAVVRFRARV